MSSGKIRVGIGGWSYAPWRGLFYPPGLPQAREFDHAVRHVTAIEINATFYGRQKPASWEKWGKAAPEGFQFAIKASRYAVTRPKLAEAHEAIAQFLDQGLSALGDRLGPILWQLAERRAFDRDDIAGFLDLLPDTIDGLPLRHVVEPRHASFDDPAFFTLARQRGVAIALADSDDYPCIDADTADFRYARLQRAAGDIATGYDDAALDHWAGVAQTWSAQGDAYVFFIAGAKERNPAAAMALIDRLR